MPEMATLLTLTAAKKRLISGKVLDTIIAEIKTNIKGKEYSILFFLFLFLTINSILKCYSYSAGHSSSRFLL